MKATNQNPQGLSRNVHPINRQFKTSDGNIVLSTGWGDRRFGTTWLEVRRCDNGRLEIHSISSLSCIEENINNF